MWNGIHECVVFDLWKKNYNIIPIPDYCEGVFPKREYLAAIPDDSGKVITTTEGPPPGYIILIL